MNPQEYDLNIRPGWGIAPTVKVSQGDIGRPLAFTLMDGQNPLTIDSGTSVKICGTKPSGLGFSADCSLADNVASLLTPETMTQEAGIIRCELVVYLRTSVIATANFSLAVEASAHPEGTTDGDRETAKDLMTRAEEAVAQAEAAAESISQAGIDTTGATAGQVPTAKGDGTWTWEDQQGGGTSTVDAELSTTSENPVQNKAIAAAVGSLSDQLANLEGGAPTAVSTVAQMVDTTKIYLYTGSESGYNTGHWYYYSGGSWVDGGAYGEAASMSAGVKAALLACFQKVAWIDENGQAYYDNLYNELYPPASLVSITATYTQSGTVYDSDSLDSLKSDLVVTANYSDSSTSTVASTDYTLSGTLTDGTSTITVAYDGKTATFNVTVTASPSYVTNGLIHRWDAIDNTRTGHDSSVSVWEDLVGTNDMTVNNYSNITWNDDSVQFRSIGGTRFLGSEASTNASGKTLEIVFSATTSQTSVLCSMFHNTSNANGAWGKIVLYSDGTYGVKGASDKTYTGVVIADFHSISASYDSATSVNAVYANAVAATLGNNTHSLSTSSTNPSVGASPNNYDYAFSGEIHAIRIYDRILTAEEVAQNYAVDVSRFNLG